MIPYLTYLDEAKFNKPDSLRYYSMVSMSVAKDIYIADIEPLWMAHRLKYNVPPGVALHFTDIKYLSFYTVGMRLPKPQWLDIFGDGSSGVDYAKLHSFYTDTIDIIAKSPFIVQLTGLEWDPAHPARQNESKDQLYFPPFLAVKEHFDLIGLYLMGVTEHQYDKKQERVTKLRWDGDVSFQEKDDIKMCYHQSATTGTRHIKPETFARIFDEIKFINKAEIGQPHLSHAGAEIIDFIATTAARDLWNMQLEMIPIRIPGYPVIDPLPSVRSKVRNSQKVKDFFYL